MTRTIPLTQGYVALVDDDDYEALSCHQWRADVRRHGVYAQRTARADGETTTVFMHRQILDAPRGSQVDHIDGDGLNNKRDNLRVCSSAENNRNQRRVRGTSRFKGVSFYVRDGKWRAKIMVNRRHISLGSFPDERSAALAYDAAAAEYFGAYACTNAMIGLMGERKSPPP